MLVSTMALRLEAEVLEGDSIRPFSNFRLTHAFFVVQSQLLYPFLIAFDNQNRQCRRVKYEGCMLQQGHEVFFIYF